MRVASALALVAILLIAGAAPVATAQQPGFTQEHWYHSYPTLTIDVEAWEDDYPEVVRLLSAGTTLHGREQWVVQISDWSVDNKSDGSPKEKVYIDGGHHGNEHLGTELAFLTAEFYIEGWADSDPEVIGVLQNTELHIMILLNADGNDADTRWNMNQVDLNRNYDHHWTEDETASGDGPFSEPETGNNAAYMQEWVTEADLYVTMHTGTWILAYPWGFTPNMPPDWELFEFIRDDIHEKIDGDLPIRNANAGIYPTHGTSRDYGYGVMGYPCFTFETDDEQFLLGSIQEVSDRLALELEVMRYLISNVWYWRARLSVDSLEVGSDYVDLSVSNLGRASTANATMHYIDEAGEVLWHSGNFSVNASNHTDTRLDASGLSVVAGGHFELHYQKRVIDAALWVNEPVNGSVVNSGVGDSGGLLPAPSLLLIIISFALAAINTRNRKFEQ